MLHKHLNFWWGISHCCLINYLYWSLIQFKPQWNINMVGYTLQYYLQHTFPTIYGLYPKKSQDSCEYYGGWLRNPASPCVVVEILQIMRSLPPINRISTVSHCHNIHNIPTHNGATTSLTCLDHFQCCFEAPRHCGSHYCADPNLRRPSPVAEV